MRPEYLWIGWCFSYTDARALQGVESSIANVVLWCESLLGLANFAGEFSVRLWGSQRVKLSHGIKSHV